MVHKSKFGLKKVTKKTHDLYVDRSHKVFAFEKKKPVKRTRELTIQFPEKKKKK